MAMVSGELKCRLTFSSICPLSLLNYYYYFWLILYKQAKLCCIINPTTCRFIYVRSKIAVSPIFFSALVKKKITKPEPGKQQLPFFGVTLLSGSP